MPRLWQHRLQEEFARRELEFVESESYQEIQKIMRDIEYVRLLDERARAQMELRLHQLREKFPYFFIYSPEAYQAYVQMATPIILEMGANGRRIEACYDGLRS